MQPRQFLLKFKFFQKYIEIFIKSIKLTSIKNDETCMYLS